jgi:hypothetical protein
MPPSIAKAKPFSEVDLSNHDFLVTEPRDRLEAVLNSFERLGCETCEIQGPDDTGIDLSRSSRKTT